MKRTVCVLMVLISVLLFAACSTERPTAKCYTVEEKFNTNTVNQWKTLCLVDEDNYVLTVDAVDSGDPDRVTADFYMAGKYRDNGDGTVTIMPGYGYAKVMNGEEPMEFVVAPDENGAMGNMYLTMVGQFTTFRLKSNGTWEGVGD